MRNLGIGVILGIILSVLVGGGFYLWDNMQPPKIAQLLPTSPKIKEIPKEQKQCEKVMAFKAPAKEKLNLPEHVQKDERAVVIAAAPVPPSDYPRTATSVLRMDTGIGEIYLKQDPLPWLAAQRKWLVGGFYGLSDPANGPTTKTIELIGLYDMFQAKALHIGPMGRINDAGEKAVFVGVWFSGR